MLIGITPGRALRWAPRWGLAEHSVLFDASSGDYWVLAEEARRLLETLEGKGPLPLSAVTGHMGRAEEQGGELIADLARCGLLVAWVDGQMARLAALVDTAA